MVPSGNQKGSKNTLSLTSSGLGGISSLGASSLIRYHLSGNGPQGEWTPRWSVYLPPSRHGHSPGNTRDSWSVWLKIVPTRRRRRGWWTTVRWVGGTTRVDRRKDPRRGSLQKTLFPRKFYEYPVSAWKKKPSFVFTRERGKLKILLALNPFRCIVSTVTK